MLDAALNVNYRDVRVIMPFLLQFGMYATPVLYPVSRLPDSLQKIAPLNPLVGVLELIRGGMLGEAVAGIHVLISFVGSLTDSGDGRNGLHSYGAAVRRRHVTAVTVENLAKRYSLGVHALGTTRFAISWPGCFGKH